VRIAAVGQGNPALCRHFPAFTHKSNQGDEGRCLLRMPQPVSTPFGFPEFLADPISRQSIDFKV